MFCPSLPSKSPRLDLVAIKPFVVQSNKTEFIRFFANSMTYFHYLLQLNHFNIFLKPANWLKLPNKPLHNQNPKSHGIQTNLVQKAVNLKVKLFHSKNQDWKQQAIMILI